MQAIVNRIPSKYYADLLFDSNSTLTVLKSLSDETVSIMPKVSGYVFRIFDGRQWHEIADPDINQIQQRLEKLLPSLELYPDIELQRKHAQRIDLSLPMQKDVVKTPLDEKMQRIRSIYTEMQKADSRVVNPKVSYRDSLIERIFLNTEGSVLRKVVPRTRIMIMPVVKDGTKTDYDFTIINREAGVEVLDGMTLEVIHQTVDHAIALANADLPPTGSYPVLLDPSMSGLIAHESMGHGLEADQFVRERSYLKPFFKKKVASSIVNISDSPAIPGEIGSYPFDEEGIIARKTPLVENGIFTHTIHSRLTASMMDEEPYGNGRRESFMHPVYPRMTNTFFEPGDRKLDELIREMQYGIILIKGNFGMEDPLGGGIQVTSKYGYWIENGQKTRLLKGITLSGQCLDLLNDVDAISKGPIELDGGLCGKGVEDTVPITSGGVWVRAKRGIVGPG